MEQLFYGSPPKVRTGPGSRVLGWTNGRPALPGPGPITALRYRDVGLWSSIEQHCSPGRLVKLSTSFRERERGRVRTACGVLASLGPATGLEPGWRAGSCGRLPRTSLRPELSPVSGPPQPRSQSVQRFPSFTIPELSVQLSLSSDTEVNSQPIFN